MATEIYKGMAFPFQVGSSGLPAATSDEDLIKESLIQIVLTSKGERVMRPEFGSGAFTYVFESNDQLLSSAVRNSVANAIGQFEPRVAVQRIDVQKAKNDGEYSYADSIIVTVYYIVLSTQNQDSVSVAFGSNQGPT
jgi:phage baseplate assembly protein W